MSKQDYSTTAQSDGEATTSAKPNPNAPNAITVRSTAELFEAVDNPTNAGANIFLRGGIIAAQTFVLTKRLKLQKDMKLFGVPQDPSLIKIDTTSLTAADLTEGSLRVSSIAVGLGANTIESLTIIGNALAAGGIGADLAGTDPTTLRIAHVISGETSGALNSRGIDIRNRESRIVTVQIEDCEFFGQRAGIRLANFPGADSARIHAVMRRNRSHGNRVGFLVVNNGCTNSQIAARSEGDLFDDNAVGLAIYGGFANASGNFAGVSAKGSGIVSNRRPEVDVDFGGVVVVGGAALNNQTVASTNTAEIRVERCTIEDNQNPNFAAYGARNATTTSPTVAGTDNIVQIELELDGTLIDVTAIPSDPIEPAKTNKINIVTG
jgi:hypothetical protein